MKSVIIALAFILTGCATSNQYAQYSQYLDQTSKLAASQNAAEAACLLVIAEGIKSSDVNNKAVLISQIDKCRKEPIKIQPPSPPKSWLGF